MHRFSLFFQPCPGQQQLPSVSSFFTCPAGHAAGAALAGHFFITALNSRHASVQQVSHGFTWPSADADAIAATITQPLTFDPLASLDNHPIGPR